MLKIVVLLTGLGLSDPGGAVDRGSSAGESSGFFQVREVDGVWWFIDPGGKRFLSLGVNHISYAGDRSPKLGYSPYGRVVSSKYGSAESWAKTTAERLRNWGFNTAGAWSSEEMFRQGLAYTVILNIGARAGGDWQRGKFPDVFSGEFQRAAERVAAERCTPRRDDSLLLGYFTDNELRWGADWRSRRGLLFDFWELPAGAPGRREAALAVAQHYGSIDRFNEVWGTRFASFEELGKLPRLEDAGERLREAAEKGPGGDAARERQALESRFLERVASRYFEVCAAAIRKADPNHLILGCRFAGYASKEVLGGMAAHVDIISYNHYGPLPPADRLAEIHRLTGKPVLLTEFSFKAMDSGLPNTRGAGKPVETQEERAAHFERYATALLELPFAVGFHWFEYGDEPAEGRFDGENSNFGLVNIQDEPWEVLTARMRAVNARAGSIHAPPPRQESGGKRSASALELHVAPEGDDRNPGTRERPFASLERARDALRALKREGPLPPGGATVWIAGGFYPRDRALELTAEDSGLEGAPVAYRARIGEVVRISGGRRLSGFHKVEEAGVLARLSAEARGRVLEADLQQQGISDAGRLRSRGFGRPASPARLDRLPVGREPVAGRLKLPAPARPVGEIQLDEPAQPGDGPFGIPGAGLKGRRQVVEVVVGGIAADGALDRGGGGAVAGLDLDPGQGEGVPGVVRLELLALEQESARLLDPDASFARLLRVFH